MILPGSDPAAVAQAAERLRAGGLVGLPTETVYGLAADAANPQAVAGIFAAKGRPSDHPLIVHVASAAEVPAFAREVPAFAQRLIAAFWPGPLTVILPRRPDVAAAAAGGQDSVGLRCPAHPVAHALLAACAERGVMGLAAPSANAFGRVSPTTAAHVAGEFGESLLVLDGGACAVGIESAIVDCTRGAPVLLRPGVLTADALAAACGEPLLTPESLSGKAPRASGTLESHYAPRAQLRLMDAAALHTALQVLGNAPPDAGGRPVIAVWSREVVHPASAAVLARRMPDDAAAAAQLLFGVLRDFDALGVKLIWVESPPAGPEWAGVADRLARAAASR